MMVGVMCLTVIFLGPGCKKRQGNGTDIVMVLCIQPLSSACHSSKLATIGAPWEESWTSSKVLS